MKRIIVCCDGTWNADDTQTNDTNVALLGSPKPRSRPAFAAEYQLQGHLDSPITFLGVWDTVGSLGIPGSLLAAGNKEKFAFHDTNPSPLVKRAVQALAIVEHRHDFTPTFWTGPIPPNARPRPPADEENDPNMLNSKIYTRRRPHHHATSQYDKTRKALDRLSGGFEVTSVIQAGKYDESQT